MLRLIALACSTSLLFLPLSDAAPPTTAGRADGLYATFKTSEGTFVARLFEKDTPRTVRTFVNLANGVQKTIDAKTHGQVQRRFYDGITFHRVVHDEMIQAGDPTGVGNHGCGVHLDDEILPGLRFDTAGKLAVANAGEPNTGGCQFFVTVSPMSPWNGKYTVFGAIVDGMKVVNTINHMPAREDRPINPVQLISVTVERVGPEPLPKSKRGHGKQ